MTVAVIGNEAAFIECKARLGEHQYYHAPKATNSLPTIDVVFDFSDTHKRESLNLYSSLKSTSVFLNTTFETLRFLLSEVKTDNPIFGFCGLPTFFNREVLEVSIRDSQDPSKLNAIVASLGLKSIVAKDQVGFVTPRVVCMIINEAYDALKNGVASKEDIDLSMKLGTNYPFGPFEWAERIGLENVKKLLASIEKATGDVRYRPMF